jgi:hypothetical protein
VTNTIHAGHIIGPIQQGTSHSAQHSTLIIDKSVLGDAIRHTEDKLADPANDEATVASLQADIATLSAQLGKRSPSHAVLNEVGKSMRAIVEGIAGGLLTQAAISAVMTPTSIL